MRAIVATANKMRKIVYTMVKNGTEYDEGLVRLNEPQILKRKLKNMQKQVAWLQEQIEFYEKNRIFKWLDISMLKCCYMKGNFRK
jgi:aspartyl-tRNA synthetase